MRSAATSWPLNGHFAITLFPFNTLAISTGIIFKSLTFNINIVHIIHHPGGFLGPPPGHTAWRWGARARSPVDGLEPSAQGRLLLYMSLSHVLLASCYGGIVCQLLALSRFPGHSFGVDAISSVASGSEGTPESIVSKIRLPAIALGAISFGSAGHPH